MYEIFIRPKTLFAVLGRIRKVIPFRIIAQRFDKDGGILGFEEIEEGGDGFTYPSENPPSLLYVSAEAIPKAPDDWAFLDREETRLIEIEGGKPVGKALGMATLRKFAKKSEVGTLFKKLTQALNEISDPGVLLDGHPYPKIRVERGMTGFRLYLDAESKVAEAVRS